MKELLRDGLYAEEVTRDPEAAARHYEQVLARYAEQRDFAASALFRLAEVRRKQDRKEDAVKLYQQLLTEFPGAETETKLARENLTALGGRPPQPEGKGAPPDREGEELARLQAAAVSSPDVLLEPRTLENAVGEGWGKVVKFLLAAGNPRYEGAALYQAAYKGNLEITKLIMADGGPVPPKVATGAICGAIDNKRYTLLDYLLKSGLKPGRLEDGSPVLVWALQNGSGYSAAEILLKNGADVDEMWVESDKSSLVLGTPLAVMVMNNKFDEARWLLEKGAKPDVADPLYGLTPLHRAALGESQGSVDMLETLLSAGADPNRVSADKDAQNDPSAMMRFNVTPLETAIASNSMALEKVRVLLKHGADPKRKDSRVQVMLLLAINTPDPSARELVQALGEAGVKMDSAELFQAAGRSNSKIVPLLLKYGANPNIIGKNEPLLKEAALAGDPEMVKLLLDAGADLKFKNLGEDVIISAARGPDAARAIKCIELLMAAGAKLPEGNWQQSMFRMKPDIQRYLTERFILPDLVGGPDISIAIEFEGSLSPMTLATRQEGIEAPDMAGILWTNQPKVKAIVATPQTGAYQWSIRRKQADGKIEKLPVDLHGTAPLPQLQWGDVIVASIGGSSSGVEYRNGFPSDVLWLLRRRISFPVSVEIEGKTREIIVRGERVLYDPTKDEVPLGDVQAVVQWMWQPPAYAWNYPSTIVVTRQGWPEVRLAYGSQEAQKFFLKAGDRVKLEIPQETRDNLAKIRALTISLQVPGGMYRRDFGGTIDGTGNPITAPTLAQAIIETQVPNFDTWKKWKERATLDAKDLGSLAPAVFEQFTLLPHPDLAHIRIRRLQEGGGEKIIDVDLAKAVSTSTTREAARAADVILQAGDIVEVPLKKDAAGPWKGFTPDEEKFFSNALGGKVQIVDQDSNVTFSEISYRAPRFVETEAGLLPVPVATGVPSVRGWWIAGGDRGTVRRMSQPVAEDGSPGMVFLRDGDEIRSDVPYQPGPARRSVGKPTPVAPQPAQPPVQTPVQPRPPVTPPPISQ